MGAKYAKNLLNGFAYFGLGAWWMRDDPDALLFISICLAVGACVGLVECFIDGFSGGWQEETA